MWNKVLTAVVVMALTVMMVSAERHTPRIKRQFSGGVDAGYRSEDGGGPLQTLARLQDIKRCVNIHELANGQVSCAYSGCRMRCRPGYAFLGAESRVLLSCDHNTGDLYYRGQVWSPQMTVCQPVCEATCENGGTCVAPNKCSCQSGYSGDTCSEERMLGDAPYGGYQLAPLKSDQRRVECPPGSRMPDGSTSVTLTYRDSHYFYPDGRVLLGVDQVTCSEGVYPEVKPEQKPQPVLPTAKPLPSRRPEPLIQPTTAYVTPPPEVAQYQCSPPCANGGECVYTDTCSCPRGYWGPRCHTRVCTYPRFESNLHASLGGTLRQMKFECHPGHRTLRGMDRVVVLCVEGQWRLPSGKPLTEDDVKCLS